MAAVMHGLQLPGLRHLVAGLVLGQDLHEGPQLQPPLLLGDPVPVDGVGGREDGTTEQALVPCPPRVVSE